ncbi:MAG: prepilin-type N-terminal cleavage/methylation domain-containing protein, partial [Verrucomicrobium sp.]
MNPLTQTKAKPRTWSGFTLVELLLSMGVLSIIMILMADVIVRTQNTMTQATTHVGEFQEARSALDAMSFTLSQSVVDAYWTFRRDASGNAIGYERSSDHHFITG